MEIENQLRLKNFNLSLVLTCNIKLMPGNWNTLSVKNPEIFYESRKICFDVNIMP